jgi:pimeloyl-ACP methyl ester carboxylesterase
MYEQVSVPGGPAALTLNLYHQDPTAGAPAQENRVVLYIHGMAFPAWPAVGFRVDGWSWMDDLSAAGFDAWALDFAGYGGSERYPEMDAPADAHPPPGRATEASKQISRAVDVISARQGVTTVSLIAHSWGTLAAGHFATHAPERVNRLALLAPPARRDGKLPTAPLPAYRDVGLATQWDRFTEDVPAGAPPVMLRRHFDEWGAAFLASDPTSGTRTPPSVRVPNGPMADVLAAWSGDFPYDPGRVLAPTLIVRGEWDKITTDADARLLFDALTAAPLKRDVKIGRGAHTMHIEEGRGQLYQEVRCFLAGGDTPKVSSQSA